MNVVADLVLPDPETLEETRQAWVRERFGVQVAIMASSLTSSAGFTPCRSMSKAIIIGPGCPVSSSQPACVPKAGPKTNCVP